jgi:hypothetical protein
MEHEQRAIIRLLFQENANEDDIHRRLQAQFTDDTTRFETSNTGITSSGEGKKTSLTICGQVLANRLYRHRNLVSIGERAISFCTLTR